MKLRPWDPMWALVLVAFVGGCSSADGVPPPGAAPLEGARAVLMGDAVIDIAHAGGKGPRPEHTFVAYDNALAEGADVLELDVHATSDGVLVLMHDESVERTTNGTGLIKEMTFAELRALDAGYWFTQDGGKSYPFRETGLVVPSLEEVFELYPSLPYVIEIKQSDPSIVGAFLELCQKHGVEDSIVAASFDGGVLKELRERAPEMLTSLALGEVLAFVGISPEAEADYVPPGQFLQAPTKNEGFDVLDKDLVDKAHRLGLWVHAWTVNDEDEMAAVLDMGVDGVITDYPARLEGVLQAAGAH